MVNVLGNAQDHASVLIGHADVLIRGNASIMEDIVNIVNIGIIIGITVGSFRIFLINKEKCWFCFTLLRNKTRVYH